MGRPRLRVALVMLAATLAPLAGCAPRRPAERASAPLAVQVYADTGRTGRLEVRPPAARIWFARVTPSRAMLPTPELPAGEPDSLPPGGEPGDALAVDEGLKPPVLRTPARLLLPAGRAADGWVDLDVRVDESGAVSDVAWSAGGADTTLAGAALRCARSMRFFPALRAGRPVAVWCRQRFDLRAPARAGGR